jgi:hypothetical protein
MEPALDNSEHVPDPNSDTALSDQVRAAFESCRSLIDEIVLTMVDPDGVGTQWFEAWRGNPLGSQYVEVDYCGNAFVFVRERSPADSTGSSGARLITTVHFFPGWVLQVLIRFGYTRDCQKAVAAAMRAAFDENTLFSIWPVGPGDQINLPVFDFDIAKPLTLVFVDSPSFAGRDGVGYRIDIQSSRWSAWALPEGEQLVPQAQQWSAPRLCCTASPGVSIARKPLFGEVALAELRQAFKPMHDGWREQLKSIECHQALDLRVRRTQSVQIVPQTWRAQCFVDTALEMAQRPPNAMMSGSTTSPPILLEPAPPLSSSFVTRQSQADGHVYLFYPKSALQGTALESSLFNSVTYWGNALASWLTEKGRYFAGVDVYPLSLKVGVDPWASDQRFAIRVRPLPLAADRENSGVIAFNAGTSAATWIEDLPSQPPFYRVDIVRTEGVEVSMRLDLLATNPAELKQYIQLHESVVAFDAVPDDPETIDLADDTASALALEFDNDRIIELIEKSGDEVDHLSMVLGFTPLDPLCDLYDFANLLSYTARGTDVFNRPMNSLDALASGIGLLPCVSGGMLRAARGFQPVVPEGIEWISRGALVGSLMVQGTNMLSQMDRDDEQTLYALGDAAPNSEPD